MLKSIYRRAQSGIVLIVALIVLVAMTVAAIALVRNVDTSNLVAGNLSFQQAATHYADIGLEDAIKWLDEKNDGTSALDVNQSDALEKSFYLAAGNTSVPTSPGSWDSYWQTTLSQRAKSLSRDITTGNTISYIIDRLCDRAGSAWNGVPCFIPPLLDVGNSEESGEKLLYPPLIVYYRITVRVAGPHDTATYFQSVISMPMKSASP